MDGATRSETCQLLKRNVTTISLIGLTIQRNGSPNRLYEKKKKKPSIVRQYSTASLQLALNRPDIL